VWRREDGAEDWKQGRGAGLLDPGLEEVGGLEEGRGAEAGEEAGQKVEGWVCFGGDLGLGF
jgi:hypothetical protein